MIEQQQIREIDGEVEQKQSPRYRREVAEDSMIAV
jgi:hypothetical protein